MIPSIYRHSTSILVTTWAIRIKYSNSGDYISPAIMHTLEHTIKDYLFNRYGSLRVLGVFPMGSQTGLYVLTRFIDKKMIFESIVDYIMFLQRVTMIPGATEEQCSQYKLQDLSGAKNIMLDYYQKVLKFQYFAVDYK